MVVERAGVWPSGSEEKARRLSQRLANDSGEYPDHLPGDEQDAWMKREAVVDMLVGMLVTYADGGRVDEHLLDEVRQLAPGLAARDETVDAAVRSLPAPSAAACPADACRWTGRGAVGLLRMTPLCGTDHPDRSIGTSDASWRLGRPLTSGVTDRRSPAGTPLAQPTAGVGDAVARRGTWRTRHSDEPTGRCWTDG